MQILLLLTGVFACATSVIFIKQSRIDPVLLCGLRLALGAAVLAPLFLRDLRRHAAVITWRHLYHPAAPGVMLAGHLVTWIVGARLTLAANSTLIVNLLPVVMPLFLWLMANERITRRELTATGIATLGMAMLMTADLQISDQHFRGDAICFGSMILHACYLSLGRKYRHHPSVWLYIVPLYAAAAVVSFLAWPVLAQVGLSRSEALAEIDWSYEWPWVLGLVLLPTVVGHTLLNNAMRHLRGQVVSLLNMAQFIFAGLMAYVVLGESPHGSFYLASIAVVGAGLLAITAKQAEAPDQASESQEK